MERGAKQGFEILLEMFLCGVFSEFPLLSQYAQRSAHIHNAIPQIFKFLERQKNRLITYLIA